MSVYNFGIENNLYTYVFKISVKVRSWQVLSSYALTETRWTYNTSISYFKFACYKEKSISEYTAYSPEKKSDYICDE